MKTKHTPQEYTKGPWEITEAEGDIPRKHIYFIVEHDGGRGVVGSFYPAKTSGIGEANARLIAAAPDLLAVCETIANELQAWASTDDMREASWTASRIKRLRAVIAKAQGEGR